MVEKSPVEIVNERLAIIEEQSEGKVVGIKDRLKSSIFDNIKEFILLSSTGLGDIAGEGIGKVVKNTVDNVNEALEEGKQHVSISALFKAIDPESRPDVILADLERLADKIPWGTHIANVIVTAFSALGLLLSQINVSSTLAERSLNDKYRPTNLDPSTLLGALFREPGTEESVKRFLNETGLSEELQSLLIKANEQTLDLASIAQALWRDHIDTHEAERLVKQNRFDDANTKVVMRLMEQIPPIQDIITMAVREVFTPKIAAKFGQFQDMPPEFIENAKKQGLSAEWASNYWAAHWSLPSPSQAFEMFHRNIIKYEELEQLLRALDIMPHWRSRLIKLAYRPLTRVDVRRMYKVGTITEEEVYEAYLNVGYSPENAARMTEFTVVYTIEKEKEVSKTDILSLYKNRAMSHDECISMLADIGYSDNAARTITLRADYELLQVHKKRLIKTSRLRYINNRITAVDVMNYLTGRGVTSQEVDELLVLWDIQKTAKMKLPTVEQLKAFYGAGIIDNEEANAELQNLGYRSVDRFRFIQLWSV